MITGNLRSDGLFVFAVVHLNNTPQDPDTYSQWLSFHGIDRLNVIGNASTVELPHLSMVMYGWFSTKFDKSYITL